MSPVPDPSGEHSLTFWGVLLLALERGAALTRAVGRLLRKDTRGAQLGRIESYAKTAAEHSASLNRKEWRKNHPGQDTPPPEGALTNHSKPLPPELEEKERQARGVSSIPPGRKP